MQPTQTYVKLLKFFSGRGLFRKKSIQNQIFNNFSRKVETTFHFKNVRCFLRCLPLEMFMIVHDSLFPFITRQLRKWRSFMKRAISDGNGKSWKWLPNCSGNDQRNAAEADDEVPRKRTPNAAETDNEAP